MYFSLKDSGAQVRAAIFRNNNMYLRFKPESGMQVLVRARVALYEPRGDFQLIVEHMEEAGDGALRRAFEQLKQKLYAEGLFAAENKRPLPEFPHRLGIITSPSGAAIRDVLSVLKRRYPRLPVMIYPVAVQGDMAMKDIVNALQLAEQRAECDVLLLTRGGGSLEDLQAFNDEQVARAIACCSIPVVTGIGHEIDYTIADFVADLRAPTPSAAAELISPDTAQLAQQLRQLHSRLQTAMHRQLAERLETVQRLQQRIQRQHPQQKLNARKQRLDELENRLRRATESTLRRATDRLARSQAVLHAHNPAHRIRRLLADTARFQYQLKQAVYALIHNKQQLMVAMLRHLDAVSPLNTLKRGYAIVTRHNTEQPLLSTTGIIIGEELDVRLAEGRLNVKVRKSGQ
jgi:exodeoxyribonuclease VII large subunit